MEIMGNNQMSLENQMISAIRNRDNQRGEQLAMNILNSMGMTKEQGIAFAQQQFQNPQMIMRANQVLQGR